MYLAPYSQAACACAADHCSVLYVTYNGQILANPDAYGFDTLYIKADVVCG